MGIAAYNRGTLKGRLELDRQMSALANTIDAKAQFWQELISHGHVLTFRHDGLGACFTVGPHQSATAGTDGFALIWHKRTAHPDHHSTSARTIALHAVKLIGRKRPIVIDGCRQ